MNGFPTNNHSRYCCLRICFTTFTNTDFPGSLASRSLTHPKRSPLPPSCASPLSSIDTQIQEKLETMVISFFFFLGGGGGGGSPIARVCFPGVITWPLSLLCSLNSFILYNLVKGSTDGEKGRERKRGGGVKWAHGRPQICQLKLRVTDLK